jgi:hypothetical protein
MFAMRTKRGGAARARPAGWRRCLGVEALGGDRLLGRAASWPAGARPELEHLEERAVPSVTTISMVTDNTYNQVAYVVGQANHIWAHDKAGWHDTGGVADPAAPQVSASMSKAGKAEVFTIGTDHGLWKYDGTWHSYAGYATQISANLLDTCYAIGSGGSVWRFDNSFGWQSLAGYATDISAGTTWQVHAGGRVEYDDDLWATDAGYQLWEYGYHGWEAHGGGVLPGTLSASQDGLCFAVGSGDHGVWLYEHRWVSLGGYMSQVSAGVDGQGGANGVFPVAISAADSSVAVRFKDWTSYAGAALHVAGNEWLFSSQLGIPGDPRSPGDPRFYDTTGTANNAFYVVAPDHTVWSHDTSGWHNHGGWAL